MGDEAYPVPCPPDDALVFDVEVLMSAGKRPTLACAVSSDAWLVYPIGITKDSYHSFYNLSKQFHSYSLFTQDGGIS